MRAETAQKRAGRADRRHRSDRRGDARRAGGAGDEAPATARSEDRTVAHLQRALGNRAVQGLHRRGELTRIIRGGNPTWGADVSDRDRREGPTSEVAETLAREESATGRTTTETKSKGDSSRDGNPIVDERESQGPEPGTRAVDPGAVDSPDAAARVTGNAVRTEPSVADAPGAEGATVDVPLVEVRTVASPVEETDATGEEVEEAGEESVEPEETVERDELGGETGTTGRGVGESGDAAVDPPEPTPAVRATTESSASGGDGALRVRTVRTFNRAPGATREGVKANGAETTGAVGRPIRADVRVLAATGRVDPATSGSLSTEATFRLIGDGSVVGFESATAARHRIGTGVSDAPATVTRRPFRPGLDRRTDEDRGPPGVEVRTAAARTRPPIAAPSMHGRVTDGGESTTGVRGRARASDGTAADEEHLLAEAVAERSARVYEFRPARAIDTGSVDGALVASTDRHHPGGGPATADGGPPGVLVAGEVPRVGWLWVRGIQPKLTVGDPNDRYEREANAVAAAVTGDRPPPAVSVGQVSGTAGQRLDEEEESAPDSDEALLQTRIAPGGRSVGRLPLSTVTTIRNPGPGWPLPPDLRSRIEPHLATDLGGVRVHTDASAVRAAADIGARAFTHRNHIFLGRGESDHDVELIAHEATHVVQQGATPAGRLSSVSGTPPADVQRVPAILEWVPRELLERVSGYARNIPGWTLFTVAIGVNPITGDDVRPTPRNLIQGTLELIPGIGRPIFDALQEHGIVDEASDWVEAELDRLNLTMARIDRIVESIWERVRPLPGLEETLRVGREEFGPLIRDARAFADAVENKVMGLIKEALVSVAEDLLAENRAWALVKKVIKYDPLRDEEVDATPAEILEDFLLLIGKDEHLERMREERTVEETADWIADQIGRFQELLGRLGGLVDRAWEAIRPENLPHVRTNLRSLASDVGTFLQDVWDFAEDVAEKVLELVKDALLSALNEYANGVQGFHLLTVVIERNPFTGERVPRTAANLIRGFFSLLPDGEGIYQQLAESGVIEGAADRIESAMEELGITWEFVVGLFTDLWNSFTIEDLARPLETFGRIVAQFGGPISRLFRFVVVVVREVIYLILQAMNFPFDLVESIVVNMTSAIEDIKRDPAGFLSNVLATIELAFRNFFGNILAHLGQGLIDWLLRGVRDAGFEPPTSFTLSEVLPFVLEVLGITTERLWELLAERIGQDNVDRIRGAIDRITGFLSFVSDVEEGGIGAIWEHIQARISGLWDMVLGRVQDWVMERIINRGIQILLSFLDATGIMPVINAVRSFIGAVQSAIEYARDVLAVVDQVVGTVASIARGDIQPGAARGEQALADMIPIVIGFAARQVGIGDIGRRIADVIGIARGYVTAGLTWLIDRAVTAVESFLQRLGFGGRRGGEEEEDTDATGDEPSDQEVGRTINFRADGDRHRLYITVEGRSATVMVSSVATPVENKLRAWRNRLRETPDLLGETRSEAEELLSQAETRLGIVDQKVDEAAEAQEEMKQAATEENGQEFEQADTEAEAAEQPLSETLRRLFELFGEEDTVTTSITDLLGRQLVERVPGSSPDRFVSGLELPPEGYTMPVRDGKIHIQRRDASDPSTPQVHITEEDGILREGPRSRATEDPDPELVAALNSRGVLGFLADLVQRGYSENVTLQRFYELWQIRPNRERIKSEFRGVRKRHHEWIPTNLIPEVINRAIRAGIATSDTRVALRWIAAHDKLRTPTDQVIYTVTGMVEGREAPTPSGHIGSFKREDEEKIRNVPDFEQRAFHDLLREVFRRFSEPDPIAFVRELHENVLLLLQPGDWESRSPEVLDVPLGRLIRLRSGEPAELTVGQMLFRQRLYLKRIDELFTRVATELENLSDDELEER